MLPDAHRGYEIDIVVVVPEGVVCLEVKNWHGTIDSAGAFIELAEGFRVRSPFDGPKDKHKCLRSLLIERRLLPERAAVGSALVTRGRLNWPTAAVADRYVLTIDDLRKLP